MALDREKKVKLLIRDYTPWSMQRKFMRSKAAIRTVVAGRQSGKSFSLSEEIATIICARPGTVSCLLMPNYKSMESMKMNLKRAFKPLGSRVIFKVIDACYYFSNGARLYLRTGDTPGGVSTRGLTINGVLAVDEGALVRRDAMDAARLTQAAVADPLCIITSTPCGAGWFKEQFERHIPGEPVNVCESFRYRSLDSPYVNAAYVEEQRAALGTRLAMQELGARFIGDDGAAIDPDKIDALFGPRKAFRGDQFTIGLDLAKAIDYCVFTLINEFGDVWILERFKGVDWPDVEQRVIKHANRFKAICVIDTGTGGGFGGALMDYLNRSLGKTRVFGVKTGNMKVKSEICESMISAIENQHLTVSEGPHSEVLRSELMKFESHRVVIGGVEIVKYNGPQGREGEDHDDTCISLALANWGRLHAWEGVYQRKPVDLSRFTVAAAGLGGYRFKT